MPVSGTLACAKAGLATIAVSVSTAYIILARFTTVPPHERRAHDAHVYFLRVSPRFSARCECAWLVRWLLIVQDLRRTTRARRGRDGLRLVCRGQSRSAI